MATRSLSRSQQTEQAQLQQFLQDEQIVDAASEQEADDIGTSRGKGRGVTKGDSVEKNRKKTDENLVIVVHPHRKRIVGENAKLFKTEACVILRHHAPLQYARWKDIPIESKRKMWNAMKQKFDLQENFQTKRVEPLNRQYRNRRHKLHSYCLKHKSDENILSQPPQGVAPAVWVYLIHYFESEDFKKASDRNVENRKKLKMGHTCGIKSIAQHCLEDRGPETGEEPTRTSTWKNTRFSRKKNEWVDDTSREVFEDITRLQDPAPGDDQVAVSEDEAFIRAIGPEKPKIDSVVVVMD